MSAKPGERAGASPSARPRGGERAERIVEAMRRSVIEVGIANSTFDRVAAKAGVSRGLLHYYFKTKERLLVEVIRRDTEYRIEEIGGALRAATTVDEVIGAFGSAFERTVSEEQGYVYLVSELYVAGRNSPELRRELGTLYSRARWAFAEILLEKEREGVIKMRFGADVVVAHLAAAGDGFIVQLLTDPTFDRVGAARASHAVARYLLDADS